MNVKPATIPTPPIQGRSANLQTPDHPPCRPHSSRPLTRCPYCSPPHVYLGGLWVPLSPELAGATFTDGICPLHLAEALGDAPSHDDSAPWLNNDPEEHSV